MSRIKNLQDVLSHTWRGIVNDHLGMVASGVAYYCFLGIFPFITLCMSLYQTFFSDFNLEVSLLNHLIPPVIFDMIHSQMSSIGGKPVLLSLGALFSLFVSLWTASLAVKNFTLGLDIAYDISLSRKTSKQAILSLVSTMIIASSLFLFLLIGSVIPLLIKFFWLHHLGKNAFIWGNWIFLALVLFLGICLIYQKLPNHPTKRKFLEGAPGAVISTLFFILSSYGFTTYLTYFSNYNAIYGALSSVIIFLIWLRLMVSVLLSGAKLNCSMLDKKKPTLGAGFDDL